MLRHCLAAAIAFAVMLPAAVHAADEKPAHTPTPKELLAKSQAREWRVPDPQNLDMWLEVNGKRYQTGNTRTMVFTVAHLVSYISRFMTLQPGDVISTGTPPGVGLGQKPDPVYLEPGDRMRLGIEGLGEQEQTVHAWNEALIDG